MHLLDSWWLDVKLGIRILFKYPGLTFCGVTGIAVAVAIAVSGLSVMQVNMLSTSLPLEEGGRIVSIDLWDTRTGKLEPRLQRDLQVWRQSLRSVRETGAFQNLSLNWIQPGSASESVRVAALSASAFTVARVPPLLGRVLTEDDERSGAPPVAVIGESVWRNRFGGDPAILNRTLTLGTGTYAIAGVMPKGFAFPVNHQVWVPLRLPADAAPLTGPALTVFGRLAPEAAIESARAELAAAGQLAAQRFPGVYASLRPRVLSFTAAVLQQGEQDGLAGILATQGVVVVLLVLVCLNVAVLVYTRTAMRQAEIALRTALGAPRSRIVIQLFLEALVLSLLATAAGVGLAVFALNQITAATRHLEGELPFWIAFHISPESVLYSGALGILAAVIIGVLPGLQATGRQLQSGARVTGGAETSLRMGRIWSALIVAQAGFAVALLPMPVAGVVRHLPYTVAGPGFDANQYLSATLSMEVANEGDTHAAARFATRHAELMRRLRAEPRIPHATFSVREPGDERVYGMEAESAPGAVHLSGANQVDVRFFRTFAVPLLAGRDFEESDIAPGSGVVIVNEPFAEGLFGGNALGKRVRYAAAGNPDRWYEIVGIVRNFPAGISPGIRDTQWKLYHPAAPGELQPAVLAIRVRGPAPAFGPALRRLALEVDPDLVLRNVRTVDEALRKEQWIVRLEAAAMLAVTLSVLLLSAAGIYALMSFTVSQRKREIGIRMALGASRAGIVRSVFARALIQLGSGAALGAAVALLLARFVADEPASAGAPAALAAVVVVVAAVGFLAALGPTRRSLAIQPAEVLRQP